MFKRVFPFLLLATAALASDPMLLTDAQKYQAMRLYTESVQLQQAQQSLQDNSKKLQAEFQELSKVCGTGASLVFTPDAQGVIEPSCKINSVPAEPAKK